MTPLARRPAATALYLLVLGAVATGCASLGDVPLDRDAGDAARRGDARADARAPDGAPVSSDAAPEPPVPPPGSDGGATPPMVAPGDCSAMSDSRPECVCAQGTESPCYPGNAAQIGVGACRAGRTSCEAPAEFGTWGACEGAIGPSPEACDGIDNDCNGRVDDSPACAPTPMMPPPPAPVMCPGAFSGPAGGAVAVSLPAPPAGARCRWEVVARPAGAGTTGAFADPNACATTFSSIIVGTYTVRLTVTDASGRVTTCNTTVALTGNGLRVELTWSTRGDEDLHMLHPSATRWFQHPYDCYYANTSPGWDSAPGASPRLDRDDTAGFGPENIRIDSPVVGRTYRVGVHGYSGVDADSTCTIRIYCGGSATPVRVFRRAVRTGVVWRVADVRITAPGGACAVTALDNVITAAEARDRR